ncbi:putative pentatricopeptide repeat-containing protein At3g25970 [Zingiber officinale]|uniref:Pentatricopeptide repeat-containing protein n=1 Tax=Zingiber officinale TaxID=94328 RepID=A0A8J5HZ07_ZINOF|nr:putative pentatricopeptide repeat-containing protein At3g25970 [Zingiber officinale]XP_042380835.1 putative pentatricopeptide repeat-containing protein At3g25970 [Zingiber officinale]KAG6532944.1 hypothetical protein ZIOFF_006804 [Zingiber officinale]
MRSHICRWPAITRIFSTSASPQASIKALAIPQDIQSLASAGRLKDAIRSLILRRHLGRPVYPECFVSILRRCADADSLLIGRQLHAHMVVTCFDQDPFVCNHLINVYGKCGSLDDSRWVFRRLGEKRLRSWNILIAGYCKFGFLSEGRRLFDEMPKRGAVSWNTMIAAYDHWGPCEEALELFVLMTHSDCDIDRYGLSSVISACANLRFIQNGEALHGFSVKLGLDSHVHVGSAVVGCYSKCEQFDDAARFFDQMDVKELFTWNTMLDGYIQCSKISDAINFFNNMPEKNVISWTTIVAGCSQHGRNEKAIDFYNKMLTNGLIPDWMCFVSVLNACTGLLDLRKGSKIHASILRSGLGADRIVGSALVALYAKCGCFIDAQKVCHDLAVVDDFSQSVLIAEYVKHGLFDSAHKLFESLTVKSVTLWNALIGGYAAAGLFGEASATFKRMQMDGKYGDDYTFGSLLASGVHLELSFGEQLHSLIVKLGVDSSLFVAGALITMYSSNLNCQAAVRIFGSVKHPNHIIWTSMISGFASNNLINEAIHMFSVMTSSGILPDNVSLSIVIDSCSSLLNLHVGTQLHAFAYKLGFESDVVVGTALIDMYGKCWNIDPASRAFADINMHNIFSWTALVSGYMRLGMHETAKKLFEMMPQHNIVSWNIMLSGYAKHGFSSEVLQLYSQMSRSGLLPDLRSFASLLAVCIEFMLVENGKQVHAQIIKNGYHVNAQIDLYLTHMYQKFGELGSENEFTSSSFDSIVTDAVDGSKPDTISKNIQLLASAYLNYFSRINGQNRAD